MVRRGIVEQVVSDKSIRVRVPTLYKSSDSPYAISTESLSAATICYQPGVIPNYKIGDVVYVAYNEGDIGSPVVLGMMLTDKDTNSTSNVFASSVVSDINTILSSDVYIGDVTPDEIKALSGVRSNIQFQIDLLNTAKTTTFVQLNEPVTAREGDIWFCVDYNNPHADSPIDNEPLGETQAILYKEDHVYRKNYDNAPLPWLDITSSIGGDVSGLEVRISDLENNVYDLKITARGLESSVSALDTKIDSEIGDVTEYFDSKITQTATEITTEVNARIEDAKGTIVADYSSKFEQTALAISTEVTARENGISNVNSALADEIQNRIDGDANLQIDYNSKINQTATDITSEVNARVAADNEIIADYNSKITQTATAIQSEVTARESGALALSSSIAEEIQNRITSDTNIQADYNSKITQTAQDITSEVNARIAADNDIIADYDSKITQTATAISTEVSARESGELALSNSLAEEIQNRIAGDSNLQTDYDTKITQTATAISTEAEARVAADNNLIADYTSKITQSATEIKAEVNSYTDDAVADAKAEVRITTDAISSTLSTTDGKVNSITQTLNGVVYDNGSGTTVINGSNITTGTIDATKVSVTNLTAGDINMSGQITWEDLTAECQTRVDQGKGNDYDDSDVRSLLSSTYKITSTSLNKSSIQSPTIVGGDIVGSNLYAGKDMEFVKVSEDGINFNSAPDSQGLSTNLIRLGTDNIDGGYKLPMVWLGQGGGATSSTKVGTVKKYWNGMWIGEEFEDSSPRFSQINVPSDISGIFIDFNRGQSGLVLTHDMYGSESDKPSSPMEGQIYFVIDD